MKPNDIKKGMGIQLRSTGWFATMADNRQGDVRTICIGGFPLQYATISTDDIAEVQTPNGWKHVETKKEMEA